MKLGLCDFRVTIGRNYGKIMKIGLCDLLVNIGRDYWQIMKIGLCELLVTIGCNYGKVMKIETNHISNVSRISGNPRKHVPKIIQGPGA